jgi:hypothetical protein
VVATVSVASHFAGGTPAATELDQSLFNKAAAVLQFYLEAVSFWLNRLSLDQLDSDCRVTA